MLVQSSNFTTKRNKNLCDKDLFNEISVINCNWLDYMDIIIKISKNYKNMMPVGINDKSL